MSAGTLQHGPRRLALETPWAGAREWLREPATLGLGALIVLGAGLRFWRIGHQGFWFDEGNTVLLIHLSLGKMLGLLPRSESTPPLYYCVAWVWARIFGFTEAPLRALSALLGVLTVPVAYAAARKLFGVRAGLIAAALTACNPFLIWYSQEARSYELLALLGAGSLLAFLHAREEPGPRRLAAWVVVSALALATHYYALLLVVPEAVWLLWLYRRPLRRSVLIALGALALWGLILLPLAVHQEHSGRGSWIAHAPLSRRLGQVIPQFVTGFGLPGQSVLEPLGVALAAAALGLLVWRGDARTRRHALWAGGLALSGLMLNLLLVAGGIDDLLSRNLLAVWFPAALVVAAGLGARRVGVAGLVAALALCAIGVTGTVAVATQQARQRPDWRGVARLLGARPAPSVGPRVVLVQHYRDLLPLRLYMPGLKFMSHRGARVRELDVVSFTDPASPGFCWWGSACNLYPSGMQSAYPIPGFRPVWRSTYHQFTVLRLVAAVPAPVTRSRVARALHSTTIHRDELLIQP